MLEEVAMASKCRVRRRMASSMRKGTRNRNKDKMELHGSWCSSALFPHQHSHTVKEHGTHLPRDPQTAASSYTIAS